MPATNKGKANSLTDFLSITSKIEVIMTGKKYNNHPGCHKLKVNPKIKYIIVTIESNATKT